MNINSFRTFSAKPADVKRRWYVVDADGQVVGRLASQVAAVLRGKHKPEFTPHVDTGDFVIVVNAGRARFTGNKETAKTYFRHTGYPGGVKETTPEKLRVKHPERIVQSAVKGMLPKGPLGRQMLRKLKVYAGPDHPHAAQVPEELAL